jgi:hypothetical protein
MFSRLAFGIAAIALGVASAASSYKITLNSTFSIGSTEIKAGQYSVEMQGDKAVFKSGKTVIEVPATTAKSEHKYYRTSLVTEGSVLQEIDFGGTTESIVFSSSGSSAGGTK